MLDSFFDAISEDDLNSELNRRGYQLHPGGLFDPNLGIYLSDEETEGVIAEVVRLYDAELSIF